MTTFNPEEHLSDLKGKVYLEVKWRLAWFRDKCPHGQIKTEMLLLDIEKGLAVFKAYINDGEGGEANGHGSETMKDFKDFIEKAETKAIGRALAALGYGTQFAPELEEGQRIVDSPVERKKVTPKSTNSTRNVQAATTPAPSTDEKAKGEEYIPTETELKKLMKQAGYPSMQPALEALCANTNQDPEWLLRYYNAHGFTSDQALFLYNRLQEQEQAQTA